MFPFGRFLRSGETMTSLEQPKRTQKRDAKARRARTEADFFAPLRLGAFVNETMSENEISKIIVSVAMEVHRILGGPGLLESVYKEALACELTHAGCNAQSTCSSTNAFSLNANS